MPLALSIFKNRTCVLHLLCFLVWLEVRYFSSPNTPILPLKTHFLTTIYSRYYARFGFRPVAEFGIRNSGSIPDDVVLGVELEPGALDGIDGSVTLV